MQEKILTILEDVRPDVDFLAEERLIDDSVLDSFDIITIVNELSEAFDVDIDIDDLEPINFNTVAAMTELIERLRDE